MMLKLAIVFCIIFGCTYAKSPADHFVSITASILGKSDNDFKNDLDSCAEMDYPSQEDISSGTGMIKCIIDIVDDLCPEDTCTPGTSFSLVFIGWYKVEEKKECVDLDEDAAYDPSCHIRIKVRFASEFLDNFDQVFWYLYDPEVTEMTGCSEEKERSLQSPVSKRKKNNLRTRGDPSTPSPPPPPPPPPDMLLNKKAVRDAGKINEAFMKSRDSGIFLNLKRKLRRFSSN
ncbi:uncharacterized protein LOC134690450 [Mytilus trossulus]|uniref:uncharacterized protein LOC134690450 n=1 Tax=Mytilus trossulus TaxID=6551 RepID=UPI003007D3D9